MSRSPEKTGGIFDGTCTSLSFPLTRHLSLRSVTDVCIAAFSVFITYRVQSWCFKSVNVCYHFKCNYISGQRLMFRNACKQSFLYQPLVAMLRDVFTELPYFFIVTYLFIFIIQYELVCNLQKYKQQKCKIKIIMLYVELQRPRHTSKFFLI